MKALRMTEPLQTTGVAISLSFGITGAIMGAQLDALVISAVCALLLTFWLNTIDSFMRVISAVLLCSILGGYFSPFMASYIGTSFGFEVDKALRMACAVFIGSTGPVMFPIILQCFRWWASSRVGRPPEGRG